MAVLCLFLNEESARADLNLDFPNDLSGWTTTNLPPGDTGSVTASNHQATIVESSQLSEVDLYTIFTIPTGAQSLNFTIVSTSADPNVVANDLAPAFFGATLIDPSISDPNQNPSLVPTAYPYPQTDSYYTGDITGPGTGTSGLMNEATGTWVLSMPSDPVVSLDVSGLQGQSAELLFRVGSALFDDSSATVTLSGVRVVTASGVPAVPEPSALPLVILGGLGMVAYGRRRRLMANSTPTTEAQGS
jgi:hypothetical protein